MDLSSWIPAGLLPKYLLLMSIVSVGNSIQAYMTTKNTKEVYRTQLTGPTQVTALQSRTFGTWTLTAAVVRLYGAYNIQNPPVYGLVQLTFLIALVHFGLEWQYYKCTSWGRGSAGPIIIAPLSIIWLAAQKSYYLHNAVMHHQVLEAL